MNINQQQNCINSISSILELDLAGKIQAFHPEENDLNKIIFSKYNAAKFLELFDKMITQLNYELSDGLGLLLPNSENFQNDFGAINLTELRMSTYKTQVLIFFPFLESPLS